MATAFDIISRHDIAIEQLTGSEKFQSDDELSVTVGLKNIRDATHDEQQEFRYDLRTVVLEVINRSTIKSWLNESALGLTSATRERHSDIRNCSLVHFWARSVSPTSAASIT